MIHTEVYKHFKSLFPEKDKKSIEYFPNGKNSIRVRNSDKKDMIFTFDDASNWKLETVSSFLKSKEEVCKI